MRMLCAWLCRERAVRGPGAIELDVLDRQIQRERAAVGAEAGVAADLEQGLDHLGREIHAALTDAETPGVITTAEARAISHRLHGTKQAAHHHA